MQMSISLCPSTRSIHQTHILFLARFFFIDIRKSLVYQRLDIQTTWRYTCLFVLCVCVVAENPFHASRPSRQQGQPVCRQSRKTKTKKQIHLMKEGKKREK